MTTSLPLALPRLPLGPPPHNTSATSATTRLARARTKTLMAQGEVWWHLLRRVGSLWTTR